MGTPGQIGYGVVFLASVESSYVAGSELVIDGGGVSEVGGAWRGSPTVCGVDPTDWTQECWHVKRPPSDGKSSRLSSIRRY